MLWENVLFISVLHSEIYYHVVHSQLTGSYLTCSLFEQMELKNMNFKSMKCINTNIEHFQSLEVTVQNKQISLTCPFT